jgi:hypothetical protein
MKFGKKKIAVSMPGSMFSPICSYLAKIHFTITTTKYLEDDDDDNIKLWVNAAFFFVLLSARILGGE